jgi:hypothetical protein
MGRFIQDASVRVASMDSMFILKRGYSVGKRFAEDVKKNLR